MHFTCRPFIGRSDPLHWCQYWENEPDDPPLASQKGHLFGLIYLAPPTPFDNLSLLGRQIIDKLSANYYASSSLDPFSNLQSSISFSDINLPSDTQINLALAVIQGQCLYLATYNSVDIILKRGDQISRLLTGNQPVVQTLAGPVLIDDQLFLCTRPFFSSFGIEQINTTLSLPSLQNIEENFLSRLYSFDNQSGFAAALIQVHFDENDTPLPPPVIRPDTNSSLPRQSAISGFRLTLGRLRKKIFRRHSEYISPPQSKTVVSRRRLRLLVGILLLFGIIVSSFLGYRRNLSRKIEVQYLELKQELDQKINDAQAIKNLNFDGSLESARQAQNILNQMLPLKIHPDQVTSYQNQIKSLLAQTGSPDSLSPPLFYDTTLLANSNPYSRFLLTPDRLYLLDSLSGRIDLVNLPSKSTQKIISSDSLKDSISLLSDQKKLYLLKPDGFYLINPTSLSRLIDFTQGQKPITPIDLAFWNSSLYLLDSQNQTVWKYAPSVSGFGSGQNWLKSDKSYPPSPVSIAINGNVWVLSSDGQISSFLRGQPETYKTSSVYRPSNANHLATTPDGDYLAFVADDSFIYIYKKSGQTQAKFNLTPKRILDLALDTQSLSIYVLCSDQQIYKIGF